MEDDIGLLKNTVLPGVGRTLRCARIKSTLGMPGVRREVLREAFVTLPGLCAAHLSQQREGEEENVQDALESIFRGVLAFDPEVSVFDLGFLHDSLIAQLWGPCAASHGPENIGRRILHECKRKEAMAA